MDAGKYCLRPEEVSAFVYGGARDYPALLAWIGAGEKYYRVMETLYLQTPSGLLQIGPGMIVVRREDGTLKTVTPKEFAQDYVKTGT